MKAKEVATKGMSIYSSLQNKRDHQMFSNEIDKLKNYNNFTRMDFGSLRISLNNIVIRFSKLESYTTINIKKLFKLINMQNTKITSYRKSIEKQQEEIDSLKLRISELEKKF